MILWCCWECKLAQPLWKIVWSFLKKLKIELPHDPAIPFLGKYPEKTHSKRYMQPNVHSHIIYNNQDIEVILMFTDKWIDKDVAYRYRQWNITQPLKRMKYYHLQLHGWTQRLSKWSKLDRKIYTVWHHLYVNYKKMIQIILFAETDSQT